MAYKSIKRALNELADIKQEEQKHKQAEELEALYFEELKKDINILIENEFEEITENLITFYLDNKNELIQNIYNNLFNQDLFYKLVINDDLTPIKKIEIENIKFNQNISDDDLLKIMIIDGDNLLKNIFVKISKYNEADFKEDKIKLLIDNLITEKIKLINDSEVLYTKESEKELQKKILNIMFEIKKRGKDSEVIYSIFRDYEENGLKEILKSDFKINLDNINNLKAYNKAVEEFKKLFKIKEPTTTEKRRKSIFGLNPLVGLFAIFVGICEGASKK